MMTDNNIRALINAGTLKAVSLAFGFDGLTIHPVVQTLDATPTIIATVEIPQESSGKLTLEIEAIRDDAGGSLGAVQMVRFLKQVTITLNTPVDVYPLETDITGATFSVINDAENLSVEVTGSTDVINWQAKTKLFIINSSATT